MATLEKIRQNALIVSIVLAIALVIFILETGLSSGSSFFADSQQVVLSVGDQKIKYDEYNARLSAMQEGMHQHGQAETDAQQMMLNNQIAQSYVAKYASSELASKLGVVVSDEELSALIYGSKLNMSPIAQQFFGSIGINAGDAASITNFLQSVSNTSNNQFAAVREQWNMTRELIREDRINTKIGTILSRSFKMNDIDRELALGKTSRTVSYVKVNANPSDTTIKVSDAEIKEYYDNHKKFYESDKATTSVNAIYVQVVPSKSDRDAAEEKMIATLEALKSANDKASLDNVLRNESSKFANDNFFTSNEIETIGLNAADIEFIKSANVGEVNTPIVVNNNYTILKLVAKDQAPEAVGLNIIVLDSVYSQKTDSLMNVLNSGAQSFADMAKALSIDPTSKEKGGKIEAPGQYGMMQDQFSELQLASLGIANAYKNPMSKPFVYDFGGLKGIVLLSNPKANITRYKFVAVNHPLNFSESTYNEKYAIINNILKEYKTFDEMATAAEKEGLMVIRNTPVNVESPALLNLPSSRQIVRWAMEAKAGEINPSLFTLGTDYLAIAQSVSHSNDKYMPLDAAKANIEMLLRAKKAGEVLASEMETKKLTSLDAYAEAYSATIDSLVDINYIVRGYGAEFNAYAMTTPMSKVSKPFVSNGIVYVVQPTAEASNGDKSSEITQIEKSTAYQISRRAFSSLVKDVKVEDNRVRFY